MPRGDGSNINNQGTNNQGNRYTSYSDGRYTYSNAGTDGKTASHFYDAGNGHSFYRKNGPEGYSFHENSNQGFRDYKPNNSGSSNSKK